MNFADSGQFCSVFLFVLQLCSRLSLRLLRRDWSCRALVQLHRSCSKSDAGSRQSSCHQLLCHQRQTQQQDRFSLLPQSDSSQQVVTRFRCCCFPFLFSTSYPRWGTADAEIKVFYIKNPGLLKVFPFKSGVG